MDREVGLRIKEYRKMVGMSADTLAERIGKDRSTIFRYEKGEIDKMSFDTLKKISDVLGVKQEVLVGWDVEKIDEVENMYKESRQMERMNKYAEIFSNLCLTDEEAEQTIKYATFLKESREGANNEDKRT